ncbi:hypothetical protein F0562_016134 [Nyssa sinensis]|uniref:Uncharacterized protein n=1 Tax=Nyssa sinensis TaxID=561372 RepID=A0A5J4ZJ01_9ASTE|nr:hypothetical protein F0562_016134 [Nyssa sinensis]
MADTVASATTTTTTTSPEVKLSWGDEADEVPEEPEVLPSTSDHKTTSELKLDSLAIDNNKKVNKFLDEPEHSNIKARERWVRWC